MNGQSSQLPWEALWGQSEEIPWEAMTAFADAVVTDPGVADELLAAYDEARRKLETEATYMDLYVPAVFAIAAPRLSDEQRRRIGEFLIRRFVEVEKANDDLKSEAFAAALGTLGPVILPAALDAIEREPDLGCEWLKLWDLPSLINQSQDAELRERIVRVCIDLLERIDRGQAVSWGGMGAAHVLALLGRREYIGLLEQLRDKYDESFEGGDYGPSVNRLRGVDIAEEREEEKKPWEQPVQEWFVPLWEWAKEWFAERAERQRETAFFAEDDWLEEMDGIPSVPEPSFVPPLPIVNVSPKVGRNEPCPCGSGKKYKKCCGRTAQDHVESAS
jgi:hypothetical protein